jgi:response regulator RpfG family c-di-GMP phosphodiesterase
MRGLGVVPKEKHLGHEKEVFPPRLGRILVVDDEQESINVLGDFLSHKGYEVAGALSGEEALEIVEPGGFDLAFVDICMPGMSGIELVSELKQESPGLPVVMMTAYSTVECAVEAFRTGATDFLAKPLKLTDIDSIVEKLVQKRVSSPGVDSLLTVLSEQANDFGIDFTETMSQLRDLTELREACQSTGDTGALYEHLANAASRMISSGLAVVSVLDADSGSWAVGAAKGFERSNFLGLNTFEGLGPDFRSQIPPAIRQLIDSHFGSVMELHKPVSTLEMSTIPLRIKSGVFGALHLMHFDRQRPMSAMEMSPFEALANEVSLYLENVLLYDKIYENLVKTFKTMVDMMESKDPYIKDHSKGVCLLSSSIATEMGYSQEEVDMLNFACYFHDVGKVAIRDHILLKSGPLSDNDFEIMKSHTIIGEKLLEPLDLLDMEKTVIRHHHERLDGSGYPDGIRGDEISQFARIVAVADVYDAMVSHRCYRPAYHPEEVLKFLRSEAGKRFDARAVEALESVVLKQPHKGSRQDVTLPS